MTKLEKIQESLEALSDKELWKLSEWFEELRAQRWDKQIKEDAESGRLDNFFAEARAEIAAGKTRPL
jgi:ABC-type phosphate transport system auxiliary subunit